MVKARDYNFVWKVVSEILSGVQDGLTRFSGPSRIAVIFQLDENEPIFICDPGDLLRGHETKIRACFFDKDGTAIRMVNRLSMQPYSDIERIANLDLDGIISFGAQSGPVLYQMWFTEHHPESLSTGPTQRWLEHTALRFSHDIANDQELYSGISGRFLREYATHAVYDYINEEMKRSSGHHCKMEIYPILNAVLGISKTREEKKSPHGQLVFVDTDATDRIDFLARFGDGEQPPLDNYKHVRKLLQAVQKFRSQLVSDGTKIYGIARSRIDPFHITADFRGLYGFLRVDEHKACSFADGTYSSMTHQAKLFQIEEALLDYDLDSSVRSSLFHIVSSLVHYAETEHFGCAIVLDLDRSITHIAGQNLQYPLDLERSNLLDLACDLARVDGALQIGTDRHLHRFACLLDGPAIMTEDRARGARYNSALRFTARNPNTIIVVVSSDRPVSVIRYGREYGSPVSWAMQIRKNLEPEELKNWLNQS